jgi:thioredoxin reductase (NADPH)
MLADLPIFAAFDDTVRAEIASKAADALFVFIGADAETEWPGWPLERDPFLLESSIPGIFAVGNLRHGSVKRVASAVGEGSMSIAFAHQYLATI